MPTILIGRNVLTTRPRTDYTVNYTKISTASQPLGTKFRYDSR